VLAATGGIAVAAVRYGLPGAVLAVALGLGLAALTQRRKAAPVPNASWTAPADLLCQGRKYPGQLSVLGDALVWRPSRFSAKHGVDEVRIDSSCRARVDAGPALVDVVLTVTSPDGRHITILTRRSRRLASAVAAFGTTGG
jgi:hypothetical protein